MKKSFLKLSLIFLSVFLYSQCQIGSGKIDLILTNRSSRFANFKIFELND